MSIRQDFERRIAKKQQEIADLELQLRDARSYLQALQDSLKIIPKEGENGTSGVDLRPGSALSKAREILRKSRKPLHINEILIAIGKSPDKRNKLSLAGSLSNYVRKREIFLKTAPNTFGLRELETPTEEQLPETFGST